MRSWCGPAGGMQGCGLTKSAEARAFHVEWMRVMSPQKWHKKYRTLATLLTLLEVLPGCSIIYSHSPLIRIVEVSNISPMVRECFKVDQPNIFMVSSLYPQRPFFEVAECLFRGFQQNPAETLPGRYGCEDQRPATVCAGFATAQQDSLDRTSFRVVRISYVMYNRGENFYLDFLARERHANESETEHRWRISSTALMGE